MNFTRLVILGTLLPVAAFAQNLLQNSSFETVYESTGGGNYQVGTAHNIPLSTNFGGAGYVDWWTYLGHGTLGGTDSYDSTVEGSAQNGSRFVNFGGVVSPYDGSAAGGDVFQSFATQTGQTYHVSFYARYYGTGVTSNNLIFRTEAVNVNTAGAISRLDLSPGGTNNLTDTWTAYSFDFVAGSTNSRLYFRDKTFSANGTNLDIQVDNAGVTLVSAIPEPANYPILFAAAGLMFAFWARRRPA